MNLPQTHDLQTMLDQLYGRLNYERKDGSARFEFKLDGIRQLLNELNSPHLAYPVIHVAGTKGKGSVSKMIGAILSQSGLRTGVYTSPHLEKINQRIAVNNDSISDDDLARTLAEIQPAVDKVDQQNELADLRKLTFFELITTAAFYHFAQSGCEAVVLEVGMGGRLDSTNVCKPKLCVITNIDFDHTKQLGNTLDKIAREKAGIIKPGVPVICGESKLQPKNAIHAVAQSAGSEIWQLHRDFTTLYDPGPSTQIQSNQSNQSNDSEQIDNPSASAVQRVTTFDTWGKAGSDKSIEPTKPTHEWTLNDLQLQMLGEHQATNASIAIAAVQRLVKDGWEVSGTQIRTALSQLRMPGRAEVVAESPPVVLDIAHNVVSIAALIKTFSESFPGWKAASRRRLVLAISADKDSAGILRMLIDSFDDIVLTQYEQNPRFVPVEQLHETALVVCEGLKTETRIQTAPTPTEAWQLIQSDIAPDDFICITGSVFLVAEMRPLLT